MIFRSVVLIGACVALSGCAYLMDKSYQSLTIETPGAAYAKCDVYIDKLRYLFYPPETQTVIKSPNIMEVKCMAPGNRDKTVFVKAHIEGSTTYNTATGVVPGLAWDYASNAMFKYPEVVYVDFTDVPVRDMEMPQHDHPDVRGIEDYRMEEFLPSQPLMNRDNYRPPGANLPRRDGHSEYDDPSTPQQDIFQGNMFGEEDRMAGSQPQTQSQGESSRLPAPPALDKGDLMNIENSLPQNYDVQPPVMSGPDAGNAPTTLFPGE